MAKDEFGINKEAIALHGHDEYIETLIVKGHMVNVFENDYGQCYWFQFMNDKGELDSCSCGSYVTEYKEVIEDYFKTTEDILREQITNLKYAVRDLQLEVYKKDKKKTKKGKKWYGVRN